VPHRVGRIDHAIAIQIEIGKSDGAISGLNFAMRDFFAVPRATDVIYRVISRYPDHADYVRELWRRSEPYLDPRRPKDAADHFHPTFWEMYLAASLEALGLPLVARSEKRNRRGGPDIEVRDAIWIEAIAPGAGATHDRVPEVDTSLDAPMRDVPDRELMLRIRAAVHRKCEKYKDDLSKGRVLDGEPFVIAINGGLLPCGRLETNVPRVVRAAFGLGQLTMTIDLASSRIVKEEYPPMLAIRSGANEFPLAFFSRPEFAFLSGIIWGTADAANPPQIYGRDLVFVRNVNATAPLPHGWIREGSEYWAENGQLHHQDWWRENIA
jgi:hypothetical protein